MKKRNKILGLMVGAVALVGVSIMGTMAYLTSQETVTNTFTVGNVKITLDEAKVNTLGQRLNKDDAVWEEGEELAARVKENGYHLFPGHTYTKDPIVHVDPKSDDCYVFVKVVDDIDTIEDDEKIADQMERLDWAPVVLNGITVQNVYYYEDTADSNKDGKASVAAGSNIPVFENFKITNGADVSAFAPVTVTDPETGKETTTYSGITVTAYAIQADGFDDAADAWKAAQFE